MIGNTQPMHSFETRLFTAQGPPSAGGEGSPGPRAGADSGGESGSESEEEPYETPYGLNGFEIEGRPIKVRFDRLGASKAGEATLSYSDQ